MQKKANDRAGMIPGIIVGASVAAIVLSARWLPAQVAWHFDLSGAPGGFAPRTVYLAVMLVLTVGVPLFVRYSLVAWVRARLDSLPIPNRDYWLAAERREDTLAYLVRQTAWIAATFALFFVLCHMFDLRANRFAPPRQTPLEFLSFIAIVAAACLSWLVRFAGRFRKP
jgi:uncharacterized membrane protein